jgi:ABC-type transport system substrate-binding protein
MIIILASLRSQWRKTMKKENNVLAIASLAALLLVFNYTVFPVEATKGPRSDAEIKFYPYKKSHQSLYNALKAGDCDFTQGTLTSAQRKDAEEDSNLCVTAYKANRIMEFDLNNNYTVSGRYSGVRNPLHVKEFRQALSCIVNKQFFIDEILSGDAALINVPIPVNSHSWWPTCAYPENYPWKYNTTKAEELLVTAGFVDTNDDGVRNYPTAWPGRLGQPNMDPLVIISEHSDRDIKKSDACMYLAGQLDLVGIPYSTIDIWSNLPYPPKPVRELNYHIYAGEWNLLRYPTYLYNLFHSCFYFEGGSNYVTGMNESDMPNYPDYDELARQIYYAESLESSRTAAKQAAELGWCEYVFNIPLCSYTNYVAWRKTMPGVINEVGYGINNAYTFLNAYNPSDDPIRMATVMPHALNLLYSLSCNDYTVLDKVFEGLLMVNPYDLEIDQPGAVQDWEVGTWIDPNPGPGEPSEKTKVTYYLRHDVGLAKPGRLEDGGGTFVRYLDAHDLEFSCWYTYCFDDCWNWANYQDVHHSVIVDDYTIEYYFDDASYWFYTLPQYPTLARNELIDKLCTTNSVSFDGPVSEGTRFKLATTDQIVQVTSAGGLVEGVDFIIFGGHEDYEHNWIWILKDLPAGMYTIEYYTPNLDPHGYYLAGLDWTETWYSFGPFYLVDVAPGVDGYALLNKNPYYWMGTPPLGETDWRWLWDTPGGIPGPENPGPDSGHYEIDIYDVVKATASYCHYGSGPYDPQYFPGGDLDTSDLGHVGIYDIVIIMGVYGTSWGAPPP